MSKRRDKAEWQQLIDEQSCRVSTVFVPTGQMEMGVVSFKIKNKGCAAEAGAYSTRA